MAELEEARMWCEWSKEGTSRYAGLEKHVVGKNESGVTGPMVETLTRWAYTLGYDVKLVKRKRTGEQAAAEEAEVEKWVANSDSTVAAEIRAFKDDTAMMENRVRDMEELISAHEETW